MNIAHTRAMVRAALAGELDRVPMRIDPNFGVEVPTRCPDVPDAFLDPRGTWADAEAYDRAATKLSAMFRENFVEFADGLDPAIAAAGPVAR
jgi:phosphoenolpyruvate carboxykinase (ATP)